MTDFSEQSKELSPEAQEVRFGADPAAAAKRAQDAMRTKFATQRDSITVAGGAGAPDIPLSPSVAAADGDQYPRWLKIEGQEFQSEIPTQGVPMADDQQQELDLLRALRRRIDDMAAASTMLWPGSWANQPQTAAIRVEVPIPAWDDLMDAVRDLERYERDRSVAPRQPAGHFPTSEDVPLDDELPESDLTSQPRIFGDGYDEVVDD